MHHPSTIPTSASRCPRRALTTLLALFLAGLLLSAPLAAAQRSAISATNIPSLVHSHSHSHSHPAHSGGGATPVPIAGPPQSATSSIATGTLTSTNPSAIALPTHTLTVNGTVTTIVGNATLKALAANSTATASASIPSSPPEPTLSDLPPHAPAPVHPPTPTKHKPNQNLHGAGDKSVDPTPPPDGTPLTIGAFGDKYTVLAAASIGGLLMVMASAGVIGMRRSPRRLLPPLSSSGGSACSDLVDQFLALERSPTWLAWIARGMPPCKRGESPADAAIAYALGVSVDEVARLRSAARWRAIHGGPSGRHVLPSKRESLARRVLRSTVMVSGWTASFASRLSGAAGGANAKVAPVELARNGPVPPALEARELMRLRRRRSDAGKVRSWEPPASTVAGAVSTSFQSTAGGRGSPSPPPPPPFPVSTRAAVMRVGSDRGSMDTELSETYVAPRRKDLLPRHPTSNARPAPFMPVTTDHILGLGSTSTSHASNRHSSSSTSSASDPMALLQDVLDPAMIVAEYGAVRLSPPPTLADDLLPDGRPRARSLPAGMLRYAAYMAAQRHAARMRREQLRAASRALGHASGVTEDDLVSECGEEEKEEELKQVVDGEGNLIVAPVYRLPANRLVGRPHVKQPSVSTMRRGSESTATATSMSEPVTRGRIMSATLAIPNTRAIDPDADTDIDASAYASSHHASRSRATSVSLTCPLPPMPATMPLPPTSADDHVDWYAHHEWHAVTPELAGTFPRRRASDVSTDLSSIIVVLDDDHQRGACDEDEYELHEIVVGAPPALAHVRSVSSPVDAEWAVSAPGVAAAPEATSGYGERTRSLSPPATRGFAGRQPLPPPPMLIQLARPWPAAHRR